MPRLPTADASAARVAAFDLGSDAGWAVLDREGRRVDSGTENVRPRTHEGPGIRPMRFRALVRRVLEEHRPAVVGFENVIRHLGTEAAHVFGELRGVLREELDTRGVPYVALTVADVKRAATGKGAAKKAAMVSAAHARWGHPLPVAGDDEAGDDEADALWMADIVRGELPG